MARRAPCVLDRLSRQYRSNGNREKYAPMCTRGPSLMLLGTMLTPPLVTAVIWGCCSSWLGGSTTPVRESLGVAEPVAMLLSLLVWRADGQCSIGERKLADEIQPQRWRTLGRKMINRARRSPMIRSTHRCLTTTGTVDAVMMPASTNCRGMCWDTKITCTTR